MKTNRQFNSSAPTTESTMIETSKRVTLLQEKLRSRQDLYAKQAVKDASGLFDLTKIEDRLLVFQIVGNLSLPIAKQIATIKEKQEDVEEVDTIIKRGRGRITPSR
jgi:hypothetical protein